MFRRISTTGVLLALSLATGVRAQEYPPNTSRC